MSLLKRSSILHLSIAIFLYVLFASLDIYFSLMGFNGDVSLEGNPVMRYMMGTFGMMGGLFVEKSLVFLVALIVAIVSVMGIENEADWVYYVALTRFTQNWMKRKKRYWVAFLPLYFVAFSQGLAAAAWIHLITQ